MALRFGGRTMTGACRRCRRCLLCLVYLAGGMDREHQVHVAVDVVCKGPTLDQTHGRTRLVARRAPMERAGHTDANSRSAKRRIALFGGMSRRLCDPVYLVKLCGIAYNSCDYSICTNHT